MHSAQMQPDRSIAATPGLDRTSAKTKTHRASGLGNRKRNRFSADAVWQRRLLPFMIAVLTGLTLFFFVASLIQVKYLQTRIEQAPELDLGTALLQIDHSPSISADKVPLDYTRWKTLSVLEANALQRRYHQGNVLLMSRVGTQYLGFVTGMTLAMIGAAFILGKLRESGSDLKLDGPMWKAALSSSSPGLMLALMGTGLMITAMVIHNDIVVHDGAMYTTQRVTPAEIPKPPPLGPDEVQASEPQSPEEPFARKDGNAGSQAGGLELKTTEEPAPPAKSPNRTSKGRN